MILILNDWAYIKARASIWLLLLLILSQRSAVSMNLRRSSLKIFKLCESLDHLANLVKFLMSQRTTVPVRQRQIGSPSLPERCQVFLPGDFKTPLPFLLRLPRHSAGPKVPGPSSGRITATKPPCIVTSARSSVFLHGIMRTSRRHSNAAFLWS